MILGAIFKWLLFFAQVLFNVVASLFVAMLFVVSFLMIIFSMGINDYVVSAKYDEGIDYDHHFESPIVRC